MNPFKGTLNRVGYLAWYIICILIITAYGASISLSKGRHVGTIWLIYRIIFCLVLGALNFLIYFKRIRNAGLNDWIMVLWFIPLIGGVLGLVLLFIPTANDSELT
jgi:uncharacterized membrane protein YhaH (DUF805 family)